MNPPPTTTDPRAVIRRTSSELAQLDERRAALLAERNDAILDARAQDPAPSYPVLAEDAGVGPEAIAKVVRTHTRSS